MSEQTNSDKGAEKAHKKSPSEMTAAEYEKSLKTSTGTRVVIGIIAVLMLLSTIAAYAGIVLSNSSEETDEERLERYYYAYVAKKNDVDEAAESWSDQYFGEFSGYLSQVTAYNEETANSGSVVVEDLKEGDGRELTDGDTDYLAYYIGWCADEEIFDSSFDDTTSPTALSAPISASAGLIEGWNSGVVGMKLGGVRQLTIPGELAYGDSQEICGGTNKPLRFIVMALEKTGELGTLMDELTLAQNRYQYAYYGLDYDSMVLGTSEETEETSESSEPEEESESAESEE